MSKRQIHWMRAVVNGLLAALAALVLLQAQLLQSQPPADKSKPKLIPLTRTLQQQLVLTAPLAKPVAAASAPAWMVHLSPASLMNALLPAPPTAPPPTAATPAATREIPVVQAGPTTLQLVAHHSLVVQSPMPLTRVAITDDSIANAMVVSPTQVLVEGRTPGEVSLLVWDADAVAHAYTVQVGLDPQPLQRELDHLYPGRALHVSPSGDSLVVTGALDNAAQAKQVLAVANGFSSKIVNNLSVDASADPAEVLLQVRFAEVDRSAVSQIGANLLSTGAGNTIGAVTTQQYGAPTGVIAPGNSPTNPPGGSTVGSAQAKLGLDSLLNVFLFRSDINLGVTLQALEQHNLLQILAEPNLLAMDGKDASFLAGGEFPFPVVQGVGGINNVTIQFKPFGVNLHFKPSILPDGTIDLQVAPEVSSLDFSNALTISGFLVPALSTRRAETELELNDGQSFVIAGLLDNRLTTNASKVPGLGDVPILGKFFQSQNTSKSRDELMVVVTARLVHPDNKPNAGPRMAKPFLTPEQFDGAGSGGHR